jgi:hypothetical protein
MGRKKYVTLEDIWKNKSKFDSLNDLFWLILREEFISEENLHKIAIYAAKLVLPIFEKEYPDDKRPRQAIKAKEMWLKGKISDGELDIARDAAWDAIRNAVRDAASAAAGTAARTTAWATARAAAWATARAATWTAARAATWTAAGAAAREKTYKKIISYIKRITK